MENQAYARKWLSLAIVVSAMFMVVLDAFIVNVALPSIQVTLHADYSELQLIVTGYMIGYAALLITGGRLGDRFGKKRMFVLGLAAFALASAWCAFAGGIEMLIAARVVQGVAASMMVPQVLALIQVMFPPEERAKAMALYGAVLGMAGTCGQIFGGLLLKADWWGMGWRVLFLVNVPVGAVAVAAALLFLREYRLAERKRFDLAGVGLVGIGLALLVYPIEVGRDRGWPAWVYVCVALSAVVLFAFVMLEKSLLRRGASPLVPLSLFQERAFRIGMLVVLGVFGGNGAFYFLYTVFLQFGRGYTPMQSALAFVPLGIGFFIASLRAPKLVQRYGPRILQGGGALIIIGYAVALWLVGKVESVDGLMLAVPMLIAGAGQGAMTAPLIQVVLARVQGAHAGAASGVLATFMQVAQALGIAALGTMFQSWLHRVPGEAPLQAYDHAFQLCLVALAAMAAITIVLAARIQPRESRQAVASPKPNV
jgi:EmrB/QacA subfamily drug resistance transporter